MQETLQTHVRNAQPDEAAAQRDDPNEIATMRSPAAPLDGEAWLGFRAGDPVDRTTWDGVFTTQQAARGEVVYSEYCSSCHQDDFRGTEEASPLAGNAFMQAWSENTVGNLYARGLLQMSFDERAPLSDADYVDSVAYLLRVNEFPPGFRELTAARAADVRIKDRPAEVPNFAIMQVVGCLTRAEDGAWELVRATRPVLADDPSASSAKALAALAGRPLGTQTFELMVYPDPADHDGHVMEVKGSLIRSPDGDRIAVSTLGMVASTCDDP